MMRDRASVPKMTRRLSTSIDPETALIDEKKKKQDTKRKKRLEFRKIKRRLSTKKTKPRTQRTRHKAMESSTSVRTFYERQYEAYCKLLGQPIVIDNVFCFTCGNFYWYGDNPAFPKKCQVCRVEFHTDGKKPAYMARPDFILDFNNSQARLQYQSDCMNHNTPNIKLYRNEYMKKVGVVRIDGGVHDTKSQSIKDYKQWKNFCDQGIKLFIVKNEDIDLMLEERKDNGKSMLELCRSIGECVIDEAEYIKYTKSPEFQERTRKPMVM
jgi:hypothetical protein